LRPFEIIAGQPRAWSILSRSFCANRVASTYLVSGRYGAGHWPLALSLAALLNCEQPAETDDLATTVTVPCGTCRNCRAITGLNFEGLFAVVPIPTHRSMSQAVDLTNDVLEQYREEPMLLPHNSSPVSIPIDMAREIKQSLSRKASADQQRVVIFDRMEQMRTSSADALLKMIEEPPPNTTIVLIAQRPESLLPTLQSRSQKIRLQRTSEQFVMNYLTQNYDLSDARRTLITRLAEGLPGKAVQLARAEDAEEHTYRSLGWLLFKAVFTQPEAEGVFLVNDLFDRAKRGDVEEMLAFWQTLLRDGHWLAVDGDSDRITNVDFAAELAKFAIRLRRPGTTEQLTVHIKNTLADLVYNVHIQTALAALVLRMGATLREAKEGAPAA